jgi:two-component system response regulator FlrC
MNILLIDDDRMTLKALKQMLFQLGYNVIPAANKLNALNRMKEEQIDCIVSDVNMPDTTVEDLFEALRQNSPGTVPIILISSEVSNPSIDSTLLKGADAFIPKPVDIKLLDDVIRRVTGVQGTTAN